jgi:hypothetical protein
MYLGFEALLEYQEGLVDLFRLGAEFAYGK